MSNEVKVHSSLKDDATAGLVKLRGNFDSLGKGAASATFAGVVGAKALGIGLGLLKEGAHAAVGAIEGSIQSASDLNETIQKSSVVFGDSAGDIKKWGEGAATAFGMSENAAIGAAASIGNLLRSTGTAQEQVAPMSKAIVQLAADLASFNNIPMDEALAKLQSGLVGQERPLRELGVAISAASVDTEAANLGFKKLNGTFTEGEKVQARYSLIFKQTGTAQGDFARTSDQLANSQRIVNAEMEDASAKIGTQLTPAVTKVENFIATKFIPTAMNTIDVLANLAGPVIGFVGDRFKDLDNFIATNIINVIKLNDAVGGIPGPWHKATDAIAYAGATTDDITGKMTDDLVGVGNTTDTIMGKTRDDFVTGSGSVTNSYSHVAKAARDAADVVTRQSHLTMNAIDLMTQRYADDATKIIDGFFDPIEERAALYNTRLQLFADEQGKRDAKTKEQSRQASDAIVQDLDDEAGHLVTLGEQHKLTKDDIAKFAKDAKANYDSLGKDGKTHIDEILAKLAALAGVPDITTKWTLQERVVHFGANSDIAPHSKVGNAVFGALGGKFAAGTDLVVGERGWERMKLLPGGGAIVTDHATSASSSSGFGGLVPAASAVGAPMTLQVNVTASPGMTPAEAQALGRSLASPIATEFVRRGLIPRQAFGIG